MGLTILISSHKSPHAHISANYLLELEIIPDGEFEGKSDLVT